jgi:hypothetical protein
MDCDVLFKFEFEWELCDTAYIVLVASNVPLKFNKIPT